MKVLTNLVDRIPVDNKLVVSLVTLVLARVALELGLSDDETVQTIIPLIAAFVAGYFTPNEGTVLRSHQESGNPERP